MGKKTDAFIKNIQTLSSKAVAPMGALEILVKQRGGILERHKELMEQHDQRVRELDPGTSGGIQNDEAIANDPQAQRLESEMETLMQRYSKVRGEMNKAAAELKKVAVPFRDELKKFETFVSKKAKSKNPFKSKKSLPKAQAFVKGGNAMLQDIRDVLQTAG